MSSWIVDFIAQHGYPAIAMLMFIENLFPPIPSELIMPFAGYAAGRGELNAALVILAGVLGSLAGALVWFAVGRWVGANRLQQWAARHGRWLTLSPGELGKVQRWFDRHGHRAVLVGRMVPAVRTLISVPAGMSRMGLGRFLLWTSAGSLLWCSVLTGVGVALGARYQSVTGAIDVASKVIVGCLLLAYFWRVARFRDVA